jgi:hypothetical protein
LTITLKAGRGQNALFEKNSNSQAELGSWLARGCRGGLSRQLAKEIAVRFLKNLVL